MKTVKFDVCDELIIKNSRFITLLFKMDDGFSIDDVLHKIRIDYPKATHYCYAYITESSMKSSDDGEPGGTAGMPMLNVLEKEKMMNVFSVVVRYFGGIKLGAGGLVRAYSKAVKQAIDNAIVTEIEKGYLIRINISYDEQKNLDYILKNYNIINKEYLQDVTYLFLLPKDKLEIISEYNYEIVDEKYIEKVLD